MGSTKTTNVQPSGQSPISTPTPYSSPSSSQDISSPDERPLEIQTIVPQVEQLG